MAASRLVQRGPDGVVGPRAADRVVVVGLVLGFAAASAALAAGTGAWGLPHNDDWAMLRIAQRLADTGEVRLVGWNRMSLVGQSVLGAGALRLTGGGVATLQALDVGAAALLPAVAYALLRRFSPPGRAVLGALTLVGTCELWLLSTSFMTDVLAALLVLGSVLLGVAAVRAPGRRAARLLLIGAVGVGLWAFTVREGALAAPAAVLIAAVATRRDLRAPAWASAAVGVVAVVAFEWWRRSLAGDDPPVLAVDLVATAAHGAEALFWTGLVLSPLTLFLGRWWRRGRSWLAVGLAGCGAVAVSQGLDRPLFPANYLSQRGGYSTAELGSRAVLVPDAVWAGVCGVAVVSAGVLVERLADRRSRPLAARADPAARVLSWFLALTVAGLLVQDLVGQTTYSRYLLALPPVLAVLVLQSVPPAGTAAAPPRLAWLGSGALLAACCAVAVVLTAGTLRSDTARWTAAQDLFDAGVDPMSIAAGQEWSGWHTAVAAAHAGRDAPGDQGWWTGMFSDASECWLVAVDDREREGYRLVEAGSGVWVSRAETAC
ncbi:hypothetical protein [Modestobacter altitudinis]|uniref:hypothetical protein n=1 Tax=Modestobacter altitudinis TaxID=2213158 RepID=UPI00110CA36E|nr:hypothetical protein [Modestobacter altitudinis]